MRRRQARQAGRRIAHDMCEAANRVAQLCRQLALDESFQSGVSKTGRAVLRCASCGKVCYTSRERAEQAVAKIPDPMMAYFSKACGFWHLSTIRDRHLDKDADRAY